MTAAQLETCRACGASFTTTADADFCPPCADDNRGELRIASLAAFKRALHVGATLEVVDHWQERYIGTTRTVTKTQTNGYWFTMEKTGDKRLWSEYPHVRGLAFNADGTVTFGVGEPHRWTLRVLS